jgi:uncharacterized protein
VPGSKRLSVLWLVIFGLTLPLSVIVSTNLARRSFEKVVIRRQTISVKGYAQRPITSDRATWSTRVTARAPDMVAAYANLEKSRDQLLAFLRQHGFEGDAVGLSEVNIAAQYRPDENGHRTNQIEMYVVQQDFGLGSSDVTLIAKVAREASALIRQGVELQSQPPQYQYTKLEEIKLQMLGEATGNGRQRAEQLVNHSNSRLGPLRSASQGVFQITPLFSTETSGEGINDTSTIDKMIKAVVTLEYGIE